MVFGGTGTNYNFTGLTGSALTSNVANITGAGTTVISIDGNFSGANDITNTGAVASVYYRKNCGILLGNATGGNLGCGNLNLFGDYYKNNVKIPETVTAPVTLSAAGVVGCATCATSAASLTANQIVIGSGSQGEQALGSLGTTTTLLHGNAGGAPTFAAVNLATDVTGSVPIANAAPGFMVVGHITGVNFNSGNTDNTISISLPTGYTRYTNPFIVISNPSTVITTATFGVFTAAGAGGTAVVTSGTATALSSASDGVSGNTQAPTVNNGLTTSFSLSGFPSLFFRVQTAQGSAATADVTVYARPVP